MLQIKQNKAKKIVFGVEYVGSKYYGWQRQNGVNSIQEKLEAAITKVANEPVSVVCAARTDAGVHAVGQVIHFKTTAERKSIEWIRGVNTNLPSDIAVRWAKNTTDDFHARFSATSRYYRYIICNQNSRPAIMNQGSIHFYEYLDAEKMHRAAKLLLGENDFTSFRAMQCQSRTPWRNIMHTNVFRYGEYVIVDIKANSFLHHMVRNIVGCLIAVGSGCRPENWITYLLSAKDRTLAAATAKAKGLYLISVDYPKCFHFPVLPMHPFLFAT